MKVVHLSASDRVGGAARSAWRLHEGMLAVGCESRMLVVEASVPGSAISEIGGGNGDAGEGLIERYYLAHNRTERSNTHFSLSGRGLSVTKHPWVREADVVNLHWVAGMVAPAEVRGLVASGKRVVWTLHDQRAFTGGCHFSAGCRGYEADCAACPQLADDPCGLTGEQLAEAVRQLAGAGVTWVTPSVWLGDCLRASVVGRGERVETIPYGLDVEKFAPGERREAKIGLGLDPSVSYVCVGAHDLTERRKGADFLRDILRDLAVRSATAGRVKSGEWRVLAFGRDSKSVEHCGWRVDSFDYVDSDEKLARIYSAASAMLFTSREDNLPNTILEALSCGCPVVAARVGGAADLILDGETGSLLEWGDVEGMAGALADQLGDPSRCERLGAAGRRRAEDEFSLERQAVRYRELYDGLPEAAAVSPLEPRAVDLLPLLEKSLEIADRELRRFQRETVDAYEAKCAWLEGEVTFWRRRTPGHWLRSVTDKGRSVWRQGRNRLGGETQRGDSPR